MFSFLRGFSATSLFALTFFFAGCASEATVAVDSSITTSDAARTSAYSPSKEAAAAKGPSIEIERNSPADTVRAFYNHLRENKLRDAIFLTNLRPAIEGLTDADLAELQLDLAPLASQVPQSIEINGEIITGDHATVTARLPDNDTREVRLQQVKLRREGDYWIVLTVDEAAEPKIKAEGANYFFKLRMQTHETDAKDMLERVTKAEFVYALQNEGRYADIPTLVVNGMLAEDALSSKTTGYEYRVEVAEDGHSYAAFAEPAVYGKTGQLSFVVQLDAKKNPKLSAFDKVSQIAKK